MTTNTVARRNTFRESVQAVADLVWCVQSLAEDDPRAADRLLRFAERIRRRVDRDLAKAKRPAFRW